MHHRKRGTDASARHRSFHARRSVIEHAAPFRGAGLRAAVAAALGSAALAGPAMAQDAIVPVEPPSPGHSITVFPARDMVVADGYRNGQSVTVDVLRDGVSVGTSTAIAQGDDPATDALEGGIEVNHPGGACWTGDGPDIRPGDRIVATSDGAADATTVADVSAGDYARYVKDGTTPVQDANGNYLIRMSGTALRPDGTAYPADQVEARLVNPERFSNGKRTVRADTTGASDGTLTYDAETGRWTAEWALGEADAAKAVDAEPRIMWLGGDPATGNELTIFEYGVTPDGCGAGDAPVPDAIGVFMPFVAADVSEPPTAGRAIQVFPSRDFVHVDGLANGDTATVEVFRSTKDPVTGAVDTKLIGVARDLVPAADGSVEVNHPGGGCWETSADMPFPDIRPHDQVRATAYGPGHQVVDVSQTTVADVMIRANTVVTGAGSIRVEGEARLPDGSPWPAARADELEVRLRNKDLRPLNGNKQELRATTASGPNDTLSVDGEGNFVAVFHGRSEAIQQIALDPATEQRIMWLGADPAAGNEATLFERGSGVAGGPGCSPAPAGIPPRDVPIVTDPPAGGGAAAGPQPTDPVLVPGLGGVLTTINGPDGTPVLRGQVDARSLARIAETGVVSVVLEQKARPNGVLYRFKIRKAGGPAVRAAAVTAAAAPAGRTVATFWRTAPKRAGTFRFRLRSRNLRRLARGSYVVEVTATTAGRRAVGKTMRIGFKVR